MSDLRASLAEALGPLYRIEREVRPVGEYRLFVATQSEASFELLIKVLPAALSLGINDLQFERAVLLLAERLKHPNLVRPRGAGDVRRQHRDARLGKRPAHAAQLRALLVDDSVGKRCDPQDVAAGDQAKS